MLFKIDGLGVDGSGIVFMLNECVGEVLWLH